MARRRSAAMGLGLAGIGSVAAIVVAAGFVSLRQRETPSPAVSAPTTPAIAAASGAPSTRPGTRLGSFEWWHVDTTARGVVWSGRGFVAMCGSDVCTSTDGVVWRDSPDPTLFVDVPVGPPYAATQGVLGPAGVVAVGWTATGSSAPVSMWHAGDGVHWESVKPPVPSASWLSLAATPRAYLLSTGGPEIWQSTDGELWSKVSVGVSVPQLAVRPDGIVRAAEWPDMSGSGGTVLESRDDGATWTRIHADSQSVAAVRLANASWLTIGIFNVDQVGVFTSNDGDFFAMGAGGPPTGEPSSIASIGGRAVVLARTNWACCQPDPTARGAWETSDGSTWTELRTPGGKGPTGTGIDAVGGKLFVTDESGHVRWVGSPAFTPVAVPRASPTPRPTPTPTPTPIVEAPRPPTASFDRYGLHWEAPDAPAFSAVMHVPSGFVATVQRGGVPEGYIEPTKWDTVVYTSPDGVAWRTPPDPAIFATDSPYPFPLWLPDDPAKGPAGYVVAGGSAAINEFGDDRRALVWISPDGVHWTARRTESLRGEEIGRVYATADGYLAEAGPLSTGDTYWTSTDAVDWTEAAFDAWRLRRGESGEPMFGGGEGDWSMFSLDGGRHWSQIGFPAKGHLFYGSARLGDGFVGAWSIEGTADANGSTATFLFTSPNLKTWTRIAFPGSSAGSVVAAGHRVFVVDYLEREVWTTADGRSWERLLDPSGKPIRADSLRVVAGHLLVVANPGIVIGWVATVS